MRKSLIASMMAALIGSTGFVTNLPYRASAARTKPRKPVQRFGLSEEQRAHNEPIEKARREKMSEKRWQRDNIASACGVGGKSARRFHLERIHLTGRTA